MSKIVQNVQHCYSLEQKMLYFFIIYVLYYLWKYIQLKIHKPTEYEVIFENKTGGIHEFSGNKTLKQEN